MCPALQEEFRASWACRSYFGRILVHPTARERIVCGDDSRGSKRSVSPQEGRIVSAGLTCWVAEMEGARRYHWHAREKVTNRSTLGLCGLRRFNLLNLPPIHTE